MTVPDDDLAALTVDELKVRLADVRDERMSVQRAAGRRDAAQLALKSAERDEVSMVSDALTQLRDRAQRLHDSVLTMWDGLDSRVSNGRTFSAKDIAFTASDREALAALEHDVAANRAEAHRKIVALGLSVPGVEGA